MVQADCATDALSQPWDANVLQSIPNIHVYFTPMVGDIDGDGIVEIVAAIYSTQDHYATQLGIFRGTDLVQIGTINIPQKIYAGYAGPVALVRYPNGNGGMQGAIVVHCYDDMLRSYDINGNLLNISNVSTPCEGVISVADFNSDGYPEIYIGNAVYDAATLVRLCGGGNGNKGRSWRGSNTEKGHIAMSFAANILGDSLLELICGNTIYSVQIASRTDVAQNSLSVLKTITIPSRIPQDGNVVVADFNQDDQLDVMVIVTGTPSNIIDSSYFYAYDPVSEDILFVYADNDKSVGYPMVGDVNGNGNLEFIYINAQPQVSNSRIFAMEYTPGQGLSELWRITHTDESGVTSMTLFDFNQDNVMEIVYRDQYNLRIINGSGHSHITGNDTIPFYDLYTYGAQSGTWNEYPVVADVNNDGAAEIVVAGRVGSGPSWVIQGHLNVIGGIHTWAPARPVWNQYMYNVTNVNNDLTIPSPLFNNATVFVDSNGVERRPFNNFLQQATTLDQLGRPFMAITNVTITMDTVMSSENGITTYTIQFCNTGAATLNAPYRISFYVNDYGGTRIRTETINQSLLVNNCLTMDFQFVNEQLMQYDDIQSIVAVINDAGDGIAQNGGQQTECDTTDNVLSLPVDLCHIPVDTVSANVCVNEPYQDENFDIPAHEESGIYHYSVTYQSNDCDSTIVLALNVRPSYNVQQTETIMEGSSYTGHGIYIDEEELSNRGRIDTSLSFVSAWGCDSILHLVLLTSLPELNLFLPNAITPSNGDGLNDYFFLDDRIKNQIFRFEISFYNRWGEQVYHSTDKNFKWDGNCQEKPERRDVIYHYVISFTNLLGRQYIYKGMLSVL